ncbi:MAG: type II toxin-antitoxin system VapC family toxin [Rubrivivax sp.]
MKVAVDTNVLVRAAVQDDAKQAAMASKLLKEAELVAIALPCLCEFVWVLRRVYGLTSSDAVQAIKALMAARNVEMNRLAVEAGLKVLEAGGDFADGVIAHEGRWLGAQTFVSFDKKAVALVSAQGEVARWLGGYSVKH